MVKVGYAIFVWCEQSSGFVKHSTFCDNVVLPSIVQLGTTALFVAIAGASDQMCSVGLRGFYAFSSRLIIKF